jgi:hypothetical protein
MLYLVKTTLQYCKSQELAWDPKKDLTFLCQNYASEIQKIRQQLNQKEIQDMYLSTSYFAKLSPDDQRKSYNVLLNKDPPPLMSITPPPPQLGQKIPNVTPGNSLSPPLLSQKSSPALSTGTRSSSTFLSPPKPGKPKSRSVQPPLNAVANQPTPTGPHTQLVPIYSTMSDSRSRDRATSAPDAPNAGIQNNSQLAAPASASRPMSMDSRGSQQQTNPAFYSTARAVGVQNGPNFSRPQVVQVQSNAHASQSAQPMGPGLQKSMPNLKPSHTAQVPLPTSAHKIIPPGPRASYIPAHSGSYAVPPAAIAGAGRPQTRSLPQNVLQGAPQGQHMNDRARLPNSSATVQPKGEPSLAHGNMPLLGQPPQQHNKSVLNGALNSNPPLAAGLRLVGPEGVYSSPTKANQAKRSPPTGGPSNVQNSHTTSGPVSHPPVSTQATFAFELDASPAQPVARSLSPQELPTNPIVSKLMQSSEPQAPPMMQGPQKLHYTANSQSQLVAPPELAHLANDVISPLSPPVNAISQFSNPHNELFPTDNIPMSLVAGGAARQRSPSHSPYQSPQRTPQHSPQPSQNMQTNASRYTRYYSPSSSPNNGQIQPYTTPVSEYKAYSGPASPPVSATATGILQKSHKFGAPLPTVATVQGSIYAAPNVQQAQYSFPNYDSQVRNLTPPISPPESQDSHQFPGNQIVYASSNDNSASMGAPGYTPHLYRNSGELHMSGKSQTPNQTQTHPQSQTRVQNQEPGPKWFTQPQNQIQMNTQPQQQAQMNTQPQNQVQMSNQPQQQAQMNTQPQNQVQMNTQPQQQVQMNTQPQQQAQIPNQQQQQQYPQPSTQITNDQSATPAPLQWTHPALQNRNHVQPAPQSQRQYQPQPNIYTQPPHIQPLSHANIKAYDSPTTPQHARNTSHDSDKLAQEYQSELPVFGEVGYGSGKVEQEEFATNEHEGFTQRRDSGSKEFEQGDLVQRSDSGRPQDAWRQSAGKREEKRISEVYEFIDFT